MNKAGGFTTVRKVLLLVDRWGRIETAKRLGTTPRTISQWRNTGAPSIVSPACEWLARNPQHRGSDRLPISEVNRAEEKVGGKAAMCEILGISPASYYRLRSKPVGGAALCAIQWILSEGNTRESLMKEVQERAEAE